MKAILITMLFGAALLQAAEPVPEQSSNVFLDSVRQQDYQGVKGAKSNPQIDFAQFRKIVDAVEPVREKRRLTEEQFATMSGKQGTVVLDARSADKYAMRHIRGAVSLPFTDFTAEGLAKVIPAKDTRVLIYCNNNFAGAQNSLPGKRAEASLNISTYIALATYGYTNIYELGPLLDVKTTKLPFVGTEVEPQKELSAQR